MCPKKRLSSGESGLSSAAESIAEGGAVVAAVPLTVGIGASAGGLEALQQFFAEMPTDSGLCFIVIVHHPPDGPSLLTGILNRCTTMAVETAVDGMLLLPNTVCVIPPSGGLTLRSGRFTIDESARQRGLRYPIDFLFRTLAIENDKRPIAVILSGTGSDGTQGAKAIKTAGGVVVVQEPATAMHSGMPQSAIDAGAADLVLAVAEMPENIIEIAGCSSSVAFQSTQDATLNEQLRAIFAIVKARAGHDFSSYKINTILRLNDA
jgi:two-component system CheB/CheR fusion protein